MWFASIGSKRLKEIARFYARRVECLLGQDPLTPIQIASNERNRLQKSKAEIDSMSEDAVRQCVYAFYGL